LIASSMGPTDLKPGLNRQFTITECKRNAAGNQVRALKTGNQGGESPRIIVMSELNHFSRCGLPKHNPDLTRDPWFREQTAAIAKISTLQACNLWILLGGA